MLGNSKAQIKTGCSCHSDAPTGIFSPFVSVIGKLVGENVVYFVMEDLNFKMTSTQSGP